MCDTCVPYAGDDRRPALSDLREDAELDAFLERRDRERDERDRAAGRYVPSSADRLEGNFIGISLAQRGLRAEAYGERPGVLRVVPGPNVGLEAIAEVLAGNTRHEVAVGDGVVWVRVVTPIRDPWQVAG